MRYSLLTFAALIAANCASAQTQIRGDAHQSAKASYPPKGGTDFKAQSPMRTFYIENYGVQAYATWLVRRQKGAVEAVPLPEPARKSLLYPFGFSVSPDERWILRYEKLYHGANALWLYERFTPLHYTEVTPRPFSEQAWKFFLEQTHNSFQFDYRFITWVGDWPAKPNSLLVWPTKSHSLLVLLYGEDSKLHVDNWQCYFDLEKHRFYVDETLSKKNRSVIYPVTHQ